MTVGQLISLLLQYPPDTKVFWYNDEYMYFGDPELKAGRMVEITQREQPSNAQVHWHSLSEESFLLADDPRGFHWDCKYFDGLILNATEGP